MATYLIGDIQGCLDPLERLLEAINFDPAVDRLWPCGDLVNRGGHSLSVLRLLYSVAPQVSVTLGNHDLHLLCEDVKRPHGGSKNAEFERILRAPDREQLIQWLTRQPMASYAPEFKLLRMHAGVVPSWTLDQTLSFAAEVSDKLNSAQRAKFLKKLNGNRPRKWRDDMGGLRRLRLISNVLCRVRFCAANNRLLPGASGPPGSQRKPYKAWFKHKHRRTRDVRIAFGHWAALGLRVKPRYLALDSGCVWGGELTAYCLEEERVIQVPGMN